MEILKMKVFTCKILVVWTVRTFSGLRCYPFLSSNTTCNAFVYLSMYPVVLQCFSSRGLLRRHITEDSAKTRLQFGLIIQEHTLK